jgi:hypothetical protein
MTNFNLKALMQNAHRIARQYRARAASYAAAFARGLKAAWRQLKGIRPNAVRSIASLNTHAFDALARLPARIERPHASVTSMREAAGIWLREAAGIAARIEHAMIAI